MVRWEGDHSDGCYDACTIIAPLYHSFNNAMYQSLASCKKSCSGIGNFAEQPQGRSEDDNCNHKVRNDEDTVAAHVDKFIMVVMVMFGKTSSFMMATFLLFFRFPVTRSLARSDEEYASAADSAFKYIITNNIGQYQPFFLFTYFFQSFA